MQNFKDLKTNIKITFNNMFYKTLDVLNETKKEFFGDGKIRQKEQAIYNILKEYDSTYLTLLYEEAINFNIVNNNKYYLLNNDESITTYLSKPDNIENISSCSEAINYLIQYINITKYVSQEKDFQIDDTFSSLLAMNLRLNDIINIIQKYENKEGLKPALNTVYNTFNDYHLKAFEIYIQSIMDLIYKYTIMSEDLDINNVCTKDFNLCSNAFNYLGDALIFASQEINKREKEYQIRRTRREYFQKRLDALHKESLKKEK